MSIALTTDQVTKIYGEGSSAVTAVDRVSFEVGDGEFIAVVGPSGSGKTTLLAMLATLLRPSSGSIKIDGQDLGRMKIRQHPIPPSEYRVYLPGEQLSPLSDRA